MVLRQKYQKTPAQVLIRWSLQSDLICLPKSSNVDRLTANANIFDFELSEEDMKTLNAMETGSGVTWCVKQSAVRSFAHSSFLPCRLGILLEHLDPFGTIPAPCRGRCCCALHDDEVVSTLSVKVTHLCYYILSLYIDNAFAN